MRYGGRHVVICCQKNHTKDWPRLKSVWNFPVWSTCCLWMMKGWSHDKLHWQHHALFQLVIRSQGWRRPRWCHWSKWRSRRCIHEAVVKCVWLMWVFMFSLFSTPWTWPFFWKRARSVRTYDSFHLVSHTSQGVKSLNLLTYLCWK